MLILRFLASVQARSEQPPGLQHVLTPNAFIGGLCLLPCGPTVLWSFVFVLTIADTEFLEAAASVF